MKLYSAMSTEHFDPTYDFFIETTRADLEWMDATFGGRLGNNNRVNIPAIINRLMMRRARDMAIDIHLGTVTVDECYPRLPQRYLESLCNHLPSIDGTDLGTAQDDLHELSKYLSLDFRETPVETSPNVLVRSGKSNQDDSCSLAEYHFHSAANQLSGNTPPSFAHPRLSLYLDKNEQPFGLRKSHDISTMLALQAFMLGKTFMPAGTILGLGSAEKPVKLDEREVELDDELDTHPLTVSTYIFTDDTIAAMPLRHSAYAYNDANKDLFSVDALQPGGKIQRHEYRKEILDDTDLDTLRSAGNRILGLCGIDTSAMQRV